MFLFFLKKKEKNENLTSRMKFLLNQADVFAHFLLSKNEKHNKTPKKIPTSNQRKRIYVNEEEDDADLLRYFQIKSSLTNTKKKNILKKLNNIIIKKISKFNFPNEK